MKEIKIITNDKVLDVVGLPDTMVYTVERKPDDCNGWSNYATWRVNLEIFSGIDWSEEVKDGITYDSISHFADDLKERALEVVSGYGSVKEDSFAFSYANAFLDDVNYYEIARHIAEEYPSLLGA